MGHVIEVKLSFEKMCYARNKDVGKETLLWLEPYGWLGQCSSINNVAKIENWERIQRNEYTCFP